MKILNAVDIARAESAQSVPLAGVASGTKILTMDGELPIEFINPGDRVVTRNGVRKVTSVVRHHLAEGAERIVVAANALGGKPECAMVMLPGQRVVVRDWRAQALWNKDVAAPRALRLVDGEIIRLVTGKQQAIVSLFFGKPEVIYADGLELTSADPIQSPVSAE